MFKMHIQKYCTMHFPLLGRHLKSWPYPLFLMNFLTINIFVNVKHSFHDTKMEYDVQ